MAALTLTGMERNVERYLHRHPKGRTEKELLKVFDCEECLMKDILSFLSRNKCVKRQPGGVYRHTNWLNKK